MDSKQKSTEESKAQTYFVEEDLIYDLEDSTLSLEEATVVAYMLEDNASTIPHGRGSLYVGGVVIRVTGQDVFFEISYEKRESDSPPTYYKYEDTDSDSYLDHISNQTALEIYSDEDN